MSLRESMEYEELAVQRALEAEKKELEDRSWKMNGPVTVFVPIGYEAVVHLRRKGT